LWGDADDARALPFGGQRLGDHRYLIGLAAIAFGDADLAARFGGPRSELIWIVGPDKAAALPSQPSLSEPSAAFAEGGVYVMRDQENHVFIDCGPIGLAGRGGHGHNDALSFEAWLEGVPLVIDRGSFVYTGSFERRNEFRATASHNTPCVDGQEINRFDPGNLWNMKDDAQAQCTLWQSGPAEDVFAGRQRGYRRLNVDVERQIRFEKQTGRLEISDAIRGEGTHEVSVPLHLAPGVSVEQLGVEVTLRSASRTFRVAAEGEGWTLAIERTTISPSYGVEQDSHRLVWKRAGLLPATLRVTIRPASGIDHT
jgi:heparinase II/III-like protein